jgi:hypothetical protein
MSICNSQNSVQSIFYPIAGKFFTNLVRNAYIESILSINRMHTKLMGTLFRYKHIIILSVAAIALGLYIIPVDHMFAAPSVEAKKGSSDNKYGRNKFGPPPGHGGANPGNGGGSPPGNTPGGSDIPPGLQKNPSKHTSIKNNGNDNNAGGGGGNNNAASHKSSIKNNGNDNNAGGGGGNNNAASHKSSIKNNGNDNNAGGGGGNNNAASHKSSIKHKITGLD